MERVLLVEDELDELEILYWLLVDVMCKPLTPEDLRSRLAGLTHAA